MVVHSQVKEQEHIATLPEEIIFNILLLQPPDVLHAVMRHVCRAWRRIIHDPRFVATLQRGTRIFIAQSHKSSPKFLHLRECDVKLSDTKFRFPGPVVGTCNGLALVRVRHQGYSAPSVYYIVNPVTNRMITLPKLPFHDYWCCLAFVPSSNTYKVLAANVCSIEFAILTVGVDRAWRLIELTDAGYSSAVPSWRLPVVTREFFYFPSSEYRCMVALNIESERSKTISFPNAEAELENIFFRPKGNSISSIHIFRDFSMKMWVLKDHESGGDWVKFPDLRVEELRREVTNMYGVEKRYTTLLALNLQLTSWSEDEEKLLFHISSRISFSHLFKDLFKAQ